MPNMKLNIGNIQNLNEFLSGAEYYSDDNIYRIRIDQSSFSRGRTANGESIIFLTITINRTIEDSQYIKTFFKWSTFSNPDATINEVNFGMINFKQELLHEIESFCNLKNKI
jgi:hypothetical protein